MTIGYPRSNNFYLRSKNKKHMYLKFIFKSILLVLTLGTFLSCTKQIDSVINPSLEQRAGGSGGGSCVLINSFTAKPNYSGGRVMPNMDISYTVKECFPDQSLYITVTVYNTATLERVYQYNGLPLINSFSTGQLYYIFPPAYMQFTARLNVYTDNTTSDLLESREIIVQAPPKLKR